MIRLNVEAERTKNYAQVFLVFREKITAGESLAHKLIRWTTRSELAGFRCFSPSS
jgi:hypothetical protein